MKCTCIFAMFLAAAQIGCSHRDKNSLEILDHGLRAADATIAAWRQNAATECGNAGADKWPGLTIDKGRVVSAKVIDEIEPQSPDLHFDLATAYAHRVDYAKAVAEYTEVLRLDPNRYDAELLLAKALLNQRQPEDSLNYLRNYVTHKPSDAEGLEVLGEALKNSSHFDEATNVLTHAINANPSSYKAHYD